MRVRSRAISTLLRRAFKNGWNKLFPGRAIPIRLAGGIRWRAFDDIVGDALFDGTFERAERAMVATLLHPGITMADVGAHHGLYSVLASKRVGPQGRVIAFEPSPREQRKLQRHLELNGCRNVTVEGVAVGRSTGKVFLELDEEAGYNKLAPVDSQTANAIPVDVVSLDSYFGESPLDFLKIDVEGGELDVLRGAQRILERPRRPIVLCEVQDIRTQPWGYEAKAIIQFLEHRSFTWFKMPPRGGLRPLPIGKAKYDGNFIAVPMERLGAVEHLVWTKETSW